MAIFITNLNSVLTYGVTATNDGNVTQHNVIVTDSKITPNSATCASLAPAATCVLSGSHNVTQAELDAEQVDNTSSVTSALLPVAESVTLSTPVVQVSSLAILKAVVAIVMQMGVARLRLMRCCQQPNSHFGDKTGGVKMIANRVKNTDQKAIGNRTESMCKPYGMPTKTVRHKCAAIERATRRQAAPCP